MLGVPTDSFQIPPWALLGPGGAAAQTWGAPEGTHRPPKGKGPMGSEDMPRATVPTRLCATVTVRTGGGCGVLGTVRGPPKGSRTGEPLGQLQGPGNCVGPQRASGLERFQALGWLWVPGDHAGTPRGLQDGGCFGTGEPLRWLWGPGDHVGTPKGLQDWKGFRPWSGCGVLGTVQGPQRASRPGRLWDQGAPGAAVGALGTVWDPPKGFRTGDALGHGSP